MSDEPIEIRIDNQELQTKLLEAAQKTENLRPLMKNISGVFAYTAEENFKEEGRPDKWTDLAESTKKQRKKTGHYPGQILQVTGQLASSISTYYDNNSAVIGSNLDYAAIHQHGGQAGRNKKADCEQSAKRSEDTFNASNQAVTIPARPYLKLTEEDFGEILDMTENFLKG